MSDPMRCLRETQSERDVTSAAMQVRFPESEVEAWERRVSLVSVIVTRIECERQRRAMAWPMPEAPPVMRAWAEGRKADILFL